MVLPGCKLVRTPSLSEQLLLWEDQLDYWFRDELALPESLPRVPSRQADVRCSQLNPAVKLVSDTLRSMWTGGGDFVRMYADHTHLVTTAADLKRICQPAPRETTGACPLCCPVWQPVPLPLVFAYVRVWTAHPSDAGRLPSLLSGAATSELAPCFLRLLPDRIEIRIPSDPRRRTPLPREWQVLDAGERESLLLLNPLVCSRRRVVGWEVPLQAFQRVRLDKDSVSVSEDPVDIHMPYRLRFQRSLMTMVGDGYFRRLDDYHLDSRVMLIDQRTESPATFHLIHGRKLHVSDPLVNDPRVDVDPEELALAQSDLAEQLKYLKEPETVNGFPLEFRLAESAAELWRAAIASARPPATFAKHFQGNVKAIANAERKERYDHIETRKLALFEMTTEDEARAMAIRRERREKELWEKRQALLLDEELPVSPGPRSSVRSTARNTFRVAASKAESDRLSDVMTSQAENSGIGLSSTSACVSPRLSSRRGTVWDGSVSGLGCILSRDGDRLFEGFFGAHGREGSAVLLFPGRGSVSCSFHNDDLVGKVGIEQHESCENLKLWNQSIYSIKASLITRSTPSRFTQKLQATYADHPDSEYTPPGTDHKPWELYLPIDDLSAFMGSVDSFEDVFRRVHHAYIACRSGSTFTGYLLWGLPEGEGLWTVPVTDFVDSTASSEFPDATFSQTQLSEISCYWRKGVPDGKGTMRTMRQYTGLEKNLPDIQAVVNYTYEGSFVKGQRDGKSAVVRCEADIGKEKRVLFVFNGWFDGDRAHHTKCMVKSEKPQGLPDRFRGLTWLPMSQLEFFRGEFCEGQIQGRCNVRLLTKVNQKLRKSFVLDGDWFNSRPHGSIRIHEGGISDSDEHVAFRGTFENGVPHGPCHLLTFDLVDHQSKAAVGSTSQLSFHGSLNRGLREGYGVIQEETIRRPDTAANLPRRTHQVLFEGLFVDDLPDVRGVIYGTYLSRSGDQVECVYEGEIRRGKRHGLGQITGRCHHTSWSIEGRWEDDFLRGPAGMTLHRAKGKRKTLRAFVEESGAVRLPARTKISQQWSLLQRDAEKALKTGTDPRLACPLLPRHLRATGKYWLFGFGAFMTGIDLSPLLPHLVTTAISHDLPWSNFELPADIPP
ncbi:MAG: hypothetical protein KVP17_003065 [Porospora cf. gigantea B]|uniref:uncharacterized protein n=1 Tax=Porospora cf. gigantea B TaxID=2853592 RepID=UPI003571DD80|nr:MAG: hypothetical protein KVP17_003065 [Porospora cf. gigantea B]